MTASYAQIHADAIDPHPSKKALWAGRILSDLAVLFLLSDAAMKVLQLPVAMQGTNQSAYPESVVLGLGIVQLVCQVVQLGPRRWVRSSGLWTGGLGGA